MVGFNTVDDAGIYKISSDLAIVQTVDFFPPVVDEPYYFGAIAVANALSDIYAMGAKPISALNIVGFPEKKVPLSVLYEILKGGAEKAKEAEVAIIGGHTINNPEPVYGLAVTGIIHPDKIITNAHAKIGDVLILTKPLGLGIITTGIKKGIVPENVISEAILVMSKLNKTASELMLDVGVNACTDITGYGFLGHLHELTFASKVGAEIVLSQIPVLDYAWELVKQKSFPGGTLNNLAFLKDKVIWGEGISEEAQIILCDAQTSGGLLISVSKEKSNDLLLKLEQRGIEAKTVGKIIEDVECKIRVKK